MKRKTIAVLIATSVLVLLAFLSSNTSGLSNNPCSSCHRGYYQYLDLLEEDAINQIPTAINLNETKTVSITIQNLVNTQRYSTLSGVTVTLSSSHGYFSVSPQTVSIGTLPAGNKTATWQITGISDGTDYIMISATARNPHLSYFTDSYTPYPIINVGNATEIPSPTLTPSPTPSPTIAPTPTSTPTATPSSTPQPTATPRATLNATPTLPPISTPTPTSIPTPTPKPTQNSTLTPMPTETSDLPVLALGAAALVAISAGGLLYVLKIKPRGKKHRKSSLPKQLIMYGKKKGLSK